LSRELAKKYVNIENVDLTVKYMY